MARMLRYEVPIDDQWHSFGLTADPVAVGCRDAGVVEFWVLDRSIGPKARTFRVFGTGQDLEGSPKTYVGTAVAPGGQLVWHLFKAFD